MSVGTPEILVILLVALLVFGPHRLPDVARQVGGAMRELRRIQDTVRGELDMVLHPEHGTRSSEFSDEPGDHTGDGFLDGELGHEDFGGGHSDFTPPDAIGPTAADASQPRDGPESEEERRFLGPPDSFI